MEDRIKGLPSISTETDIAFAKHAGIGIFAGGIGMAISDIVTTVVVSCQSKRE